MPLGLEGVLYHAAALPASLPSSQSLLVSGQHLTLALTQHSGAFADLQVILRAMTGKDVGVRDVRYTTRQLMNKCRRGPLASLM